MARTVIAPQPGPQTAFARSAADIAIYGGSAGCGKTFALLLEPLAYKEVPGFSAVVFRRTYPQIRNPGGLWDEARKLYPHVGGAGLVHAAEWRWQNGFKVAMRQLEREDSVYDWQGAQVPLICFDELTHFERSQFFYMLSRARSTTGMKATVRATCNADADSWVADFLSWWIGEDGFAVPERSGKWRWFGRSGDRIVWAGTKAEIEADLGPHSAMSVTFVSGRLSDNPMMSEADPGYLAKLRALPNVERQRLEMGNWKIRATAGNVFRSEWFEVVPAAPSRAARTVRYWDRAATKESKQNRDPDWACGVKVAKDPDGRFFVIDVARLRGTPMDVERAIRNTATQDGKGCELWLQTDPGQAGKVERDYYARQLAEFGVRFDPVPRTEKLKRAAPFSAQAEAGNVRLVAGRWVKEFLDECVSFPDGPHDDQVDAASGGWKVVATGARDYDLVAPASRVAFDQRPLLG